MRAVVQLKQDLLESFRQLLLDPVGNIASRTDNFRDKAKSVNVLVSAARLTIRSKLGGGEISKQDQLIILEYCTTVSSLEYRNSVWSYEYMALSRRMGELWERFCKTAWEEPVREDV